MLPARRVLFMVACSELRGDNPGRILYDESAQIIDASPRCTLDALPCRKGTASGMPASDDLGRFPAAGRCRHSGVPVTIRWLDQACLWVYSRDKIGDTHHHICVCACAKDRK